MHYQWRSQMRKRPSMLQMICTYVQASAFLLLAIAHAVLAVLGWVYGPERPTTWLNTVVMWPLFYLAWCEFAKANQQRHRRKFGEHFYPSGI